MSTPRKITFTLDLEDHTGGADLSRRYLANASRILNFLEELEIHATVFIVGDIVEQCADLINRGCRAGHEFALHSATHIPLTAQDDSKLRPLLVDAKKRLEDISGSAVLGFRAPIFSLTAKTTWVTPLLTELGFIYSSSVLPAPNPLFGFAGAPKHSFLWPSGLVELPAPIVHVGGTKLPILGGIYLRYLPQWATRKMVRRIDSDTLLWSYIHPYDVDANEGYFQFPGTNKPMSFLLWRKRKHTLEKLRALAHGSGLSAGQPLAQRVIDLDHSKLPVFEGNAAPDHVLH